MKIKLLSVIITSLFVSSCMTAGSKKASIDVNLIIPGKTAEGYTVGERIENSRDIVYTGEENEIGKILDLQFFSGLKFNSYIYTRDSSVLFINDGIITGIAGFKIERRITSDAVLLSDGIDNFILNYGNSGLLTAVKKKHRVYYYRELGIAIFSNDSDNVIDMYLVFKAVPKIPFSRKGTI